MTATTRNDGTAPPAPWWRPGTPDTWLAGVHDAAAELFRATSGQVLPGPDRPLFVGPIDAPHRTEVVALDVAGDAPPTLRFFADLSTWRHWRELAPDDRDPAAARRPGHDVLRFVAGAELTDAVRRQVIDRGWTLASDGAWPIVHTVGPDGGTHPVAPERLPDHEAILRALTDVLSDPPAGWRDAWREGTARETVRTVDTDEGEIEMRLDTAAPPFMTLFDGTDAELLAAFERLDWSEGLDGVDDARLATLERTLIARMRRHAPRLPPDAPHAGIELLLDVVPGAFGKPVTLLTADELESLVLEAVPYRVPVPPSGARPLLDHLADTWDWLTRRGDLAHGEACLALLRSDDLVARLTDALADESLFGPEKRHHMDGTAAGFDMATDEGRHRYLLQRRGQRVAATGAVDPVFGRPADERPRPNAQRRRKAKADRKAARRSRKRNR